MRINLPIDLLRSFAAIVDAGSMSRAAQDIYLTQSALSLQMKRLAEIVQAPIFQRHRRGVVLTDDGRTLLAYARAILGLNDQAVSSLTGGPLTGPARIGIFQDFADELLSGVLARFAAVHLGVQLQIRIGNSAELFGAVSSGLLDVSICLVAADDDAAITRSPMIWLGRPELAQERPIRLVLMEKPCIFRDAAIAALEANGLAYNIVLETPSVSVLKAAIDAGLGITCRTAAFLDDASFRLARLDVPLPQFAISLHTGPFLPKAIERLASLMRDAIVDLVATNERKAN